MSNSAKQRLTLTNLSEPQQMRELNRQLTWIWDQLLGGLSMKSLNETARSVIDSKAEVETVNELTDELTRQSTRISQTAEKIELKADKEIVDDLGRVVSTHSTLISQTADKIDLKADKTVVDDLGKTVESHSTLISQTADKIELKADKEIVDDLGKTVEDNHAEFELTANNISQRVTDEVKGLQSQIDVNAEAVTIVAGRTVGGTNLISCAEGNIWVLTGGVNYNWGKSKSCQSGVAAMMLAWTGSHNEVDYNSDIDLEPGTYMLSFWCWYASLTTSVTIRPNILGSGYDKYFDQYAFGPNPGIPKKYSFPLEVDYTGRAKFRFVTMTPWTVGEVYFTDVKLERGNTATEWSPYPGDPAGELDTGTGGGVQVTITKDRFNVNVPGEDGDFELNETGGVLPVLNSQHVDSPNLAYAYDGPATITVKPTAKSEEIAAGGVYKSLPEAFGRLNNRMLAYDVTINVVGDSYGDAELRGVLGGYTVYVYGGEHALYGHVDITGCQASVKIYDLSAVWTSSGATTACTLSNCADVTLYQCIFDANGINDALWIGQAVRAFIRECEFYNALYTLICLAYTADATIVNAKGGNATNFAYTDGATVRWGGTRPDGVWAKGNASLTAPSDLNALTINYGSATPSAPTITTAEYPMQHADSYATGFEESWDYQQHNDIMQGYTEHAGRIYGCIWFDNAAIRAAVAGKTVNQATIRLTAQKYVGRGVAVEVHLYGTTTEYAGRNGPPVLVNYEGGGYGVIGTATPGETTTISIPVEAAADLASGAINGLVLFSDDETLYGNRNYSRNYMRFDGATSGDASTRPVLTVTY